MRLQEQNKVQERDSVSSERLRSSALSLTLVESANHMSIMAVSRLLKAFIFLFS